MALEARLEELRSYVGLSAEDAALLLRFCPLAKPSFSAIADEFYAIVRMHPGAFAVLEGETQAVRLHESLEVWMGELLSGPYDRAFLERHARIGEVHVRVGLGPRFMVTAMSRVRGSLQRVAALALADDPTTSAATALAIGRVCDLALSILLDSYQRALLAQIELAGRKEREAIHSQLDERKRADGLAAGLAHEIRNPLNGASLHLSVIERGLARSGDVPAPMREAAEVLRNEIRRLGSLVTDFLEVARPRPLVPVESDINALAQGVRVLLEAEAEAHGVSLMVEPFAFPVLLRVDVERTNQVLVNLVRNSLDAVKVGGKVVIRVRRLPDHVEIDVADDGIGVADPNAPVFDPFYTTKDRGAGLGLSIVQRVVNDHGGEVSFSSQPGSTTFTVRLPCEAAQSLL